MVFVIIKDGHSPVILFLPAERRNKMCLGEVVVGVCHHISRIQPIDDTEQLTVGNGAAQLVKGIKPAFVRDGIPDKLIRPRRLHIEPMAVPPTARKRKPITEALHKGYAEKASAMKMNANISIISEQSSWLAVFLLVFFTKQPL